MDLNHEIKENQVEYDDIFINTCFSYMTNNLGEIKARTPEAMEMYTDTIRKLPATATQIMILKSMPVAERRIMRSLFLLK
jgi:hypothetical protein